ncbi:hypothetical protein ACFW2I_36365 [Streptomyces nigra]|uniref:hypothetical protein n=1 Tax=Streptomyces nigra TaxID=1827580 RepID=UPI00368216B1
MTGQPDGVLVPDPRTFKVLPGLDRTGWILSDLHYRSGERVPFDTRRILQEQVGRLALDGYEFVLGIELEFYLARLDDPKLTWQDAGHPPESPSVGPVARGFSVPDGIQKR